MSRSLLRGLLAASVLAAGPAIAAPKVAVDIPPVHSLVASVMQGVGEPALIVRPGASPHGYSMRPSEAAALEEADVTFWVGEELTPWLGRAMNTLAAEATSVALMDVEGIVRLDYREGATFGAHDHDHDADHDAEHAEDHEHGDTHAQADADDHDHDHDHAHDDDHDHDHAHDDDHAHDHDHEGADPHAWLDPVNAKVFVDTIAATLANADPDNASAYERNAQDTKAKLDTLIAEIEGDLAPLRGRNFVVFHDAYYYFENRFGMEASGAIALSDAASPSPSRVAEIRDAIAQMDAACVFAEPQFEPDLVQTVIEGTDASTGILDPLGAELPLGPDLYPTLLSNLRDSLVACLEA